MRSKRWKCWLCDWICFWYPGHRRFHQHCVKRDWCFNALVVVATPLHFTVMCFQSVEFFWILWLWFGSISINSLEQNKTSLTITLNIFSWYFLSGLQPTITLLLLDEQIGTNKCLIFLLKNDKQLTNYQHSWQMLMFVYSDIYCMSVLQKWVRGICSLLLFELSSDF